MNPQLVVIFSSWPQLNNCRVPGIEAGGVICDVNPLLLEEYFLNFNAPIF